MSTSNLNYRSSTGSQLPHDHRALRQLARFEPLQVQKVPVPEALPGSAVVRVELASVLSYAKDIYNGVRQYPYPVPLTTGAGAAIGRVVALGQDAVRLKVGDLCLLDPTIRARDGAGDIFLSGIYDGFTESSRKLMKDGGFRDSIYAEYVRWPLECTFVLNESALMGDHLGYTHEDLLFIPKMLVSYGGLGPNGVHVKPGETVIVAPATGGFGAAAVHVCLELGAGRVIVMGRNMSTIEQLKASEPSDRRDRIVGVRLTGNWEDDLKSLNAAKGEGQEIDVYFDISPPMAQDSGHFKACVMALGYGGRVSLMGGILGDVVLPHLKIMHWNITIKGKWMYERNDVRECIKLVETGTVRLQNHDKGWNMLGSSCVKTFALEEWEEAFNEAQRIDKDGIIAFKP